MGEEPEGGGLMGRIPVIPEISPGKLAAVLLVIGSVLFISVIFNIPVPNGQDVNGDGISDNFQRIHPREDILKKDGEWVVEIVGYEAEPDIPFLLFVGSVLLVLIPFGSALWLWDRPRRRSGIERWSEQGKMHDAVRRMAAFLEINPSLPSAVRLTRSSMPERDQSLLGSMIWAPFSEGRSFNSVYGAFTEEWKSRSTMLGNALQGLSSAEKESGQAEVMISARAVVSRLSEGTRAMMESYSRSLSGPSTALFGIGVLLPVLLATMIPITGMTVRTAVLLGFILWFVLPSGIMLVGSRLIVKRPTLGAGDDVQAVPSVNPGLKDIGLVIAGSSIIVLGIYLVVKGIDLGFPLEIRSLLVLAVFLGLSLISAGAINASTNRSASKEMEWSRMRSRSPGILRAVSSSIQEGHSFEHALKCSFKDMEERLLPGEEMDGSGICEPLLSYLISSREFSRGGRITGSKAVRAYSKHIQDMIDLERDLSSRIRSTVGQMETTASVFAPLMIGISAGIFTLIGSIGDDIPAGMLFSSSTTGALKSWHFLLLASGYLFTLSIVTTLTIYRLENGRTKGGWHKVPRRLVQSSLAFCAGAIGSSLFIG
jgi:hypothetical protein